MNATMSSTRVLGSTRPESSQTHHREKLTIFATEWFFTPKGVSTVTDKFNYMLQRNHLHSTQAKIQWSDTDCAWHIRSVKDSKIINEEFAKIIQLVLLQANMDEYISDSDSEADSEDNSVIPRAEDEVNTGTVIRLSKWKSLNNSNHSEGSENNEAQVTLTEEPNIVGTATRDGLPEEIKPFKAKATWELNNSELSLEDVISESTLQELSKLTFTTSVKHLQKIFVGADTEDNITCLLKKLNVIKKQAEAVAGYFNHIFYTEELEDIRLQLVYFTAVNDVFFRTTILDDLQLFPNNNYDNLHLAVTVRRAVYDSNKGSYLLKELWKPSPAVFDVETPSRIWGANWTFNARGNDPMDILGAVTSYGAPADATLPCADVVRVVQSPRHIPLEPEQDLLDGLETLGPSNASVAFPVNKTVVTGWASQIPLDARPESVEITPSVPLEAIPQIPPEWERVTDLDHQGDLEVQHKESKASYINAGLVAKVDLIRSSNQRASSMGSVVQHSTRPPTPSSNQTPHSVMTHRVISPPPGFHCQGPILRCAQVLSPLQDRSFDSQTNLLDDDMLNSNRVMNIIALQPSGHATPEPLSLANVPEERVEVEVEGDLIDFDTELVQQNDEVSSRIFRNTMNLLAPKPKGNRINGKSNPFPGRLEPPSPPRAFKALKTSLPDPSIEFITQMNHSFEAMIQGFRAYRGDIQVNAEFGRIIIKSLHAKHVGLNKTPQQVLNLLQAGLVTFFTNKLSIPPADIHYLIDLEDSRGARIWEEKPSSCRVFYEIHCHDFGRPGYYPFTIEVDGENFLTDVKIKRQLSEIYIHGANRQWDIRLSATGFEVGSEFEGAYQTLARGIQSSLYVPPGMEMPKLAFYADSSLLGDNKLIIDGIRAHRVSDTYSVDKKSIMRVAEVQILNTEIQVFEEQKKTLYSGYSNVDSLGQYWHEVSISSVTANQMLLGNKSIELGDEASWTAESFSRVEAAQAMYLPACKMLKQMDGVGFLNNNMVDITTIIPPTAMEKSRVPYQFW